ncbi:hypothetical protein BGW36DRAFT_373497 [Talaromyces proteolyticus]|uniref:Uncharacterized protein n=1 Tax=Talaromyces proteolyticus TaxID=1131652 RepID=A0AAD4Q2A8_9EURO|nr:uncharacterized protein BGW36DRAFT_373497 [Talaromyces proteolyticus]KAH8700133.1 hypothetical protein BGW36DRAFT_373497 [Talaromyces proteolyticus]
MDPQASIGRGEMAEILASLQENNNETAANVDACHEKVASPLTGIFTTDKSFSSLPRHTDKLMSNLRMPLLLFSDDKADTLVYIDAAATEQTKHRWFPLSQANNNIIPHRIHSQKLLSTGSPVLKGLFEPRRQARARRRYGLTQNMPPSIKHVIDLTPALEGDDAVVYMTELSCPMGVRKWAQYQPGWRLPSICVSGKDEVEWLEVIEVESPKVEPSTTTSPSGKGSKKGSTQGKGNGKEKDNKVKKRPRSPRRILNWEGNLPTLRSEPPAQSTKKSADIDEEDMPPMMKRIPGLPLDYSPIRHRTCLERILHSLEELDPELDSAPKMWTFFALAKLLGIVENPLIGDHIVAWLYEGNNPLFVEVNPELAYRMACGLKNTQLCQSSFAILVGEEALSLLNLSMNGLIPRRVAQTMYGRTRESLDDTELQRIEYASKVFLDRILNTFIQLAGNQMGWLEIIIRKHIKGPVTPSHEPVINNLISFFKDCVRSRICEVLQRQRVPDIDFEYHIATQDNYPGLKHQTAIADMPYICRILTRTFWKSLNSSVSFLGGMDIAKVLLRYSSLKDMAPELPSFKDQECATIPYISPADVQLSLDNFHTLANGFDSLHWANLSTRNYSNQRLLEEDAVIYFDTDRCEADIGFYLGVVASGIIAAPNSIGPVNDGVQFHTVDTLISLSEDEFKFLPLWAGGNDDGTGGVFIDNDVPMIEAGGFSTAGPSIHTGYSAPSEAGDSMGSSFDSIDPDEAVSTVHRASHEATDSYATTVRSAFSTGSSTFELVEEVRGMDIKGEQSGTVSGKDHDIDFDIDTLESDNDFYLEDYDDDDDDDNDNDTVGASDKN